MSEIGSLLKDAIEKKGWSITEAAREIDVDRSFLSRLLSGSPPPRKLTGSRTTAGPDDRYQKIARTLELNEDSFLERVTVEQRRRFRSRSETPEPEKTAPAALDTIKERYPKLQHLLNPDSLGKGIAALQNLAEDSLAALLSRFEAQSWQERIKGSRYSSDPNRYLDHDHLGSRHGSGFRFLYLSDSQICQQIAEVLTDDRSRQAGGYEDSGDETSAARVEIASMFIELSFYFRSVVSEK